jgi:glutathione synthase/RimK-type ligase-like ATP-grasp enzyme
MIVVWGPADDPPIAGVCTVLDGRAAEFVHIDDADLGSLSYDITIGRDPRGRLDVDGRAIAVEAIRSMYLRPDRVSHGPPTTASTSMLTVAATMKGTVVNPPLAGWSNHAKPFQSTLIAAAGLPVPPTLVTTDPRAARCFLATHGRIVYKSISGVRSIVATIGDEEADRLDGVRTGPVQLQRWVDGLDVRVHVVGERWFATAVEGEGDDYRYSSVGGEGPCMRPYALPDELGARLVGLTSSLGLVVSGIDLRRAPDGTWCCFEVNPSPGYTFYEERTGQPIAGAIADLLMA